MDQFILNKMKDGHELGPILQVTETVCRLYLNKI